MSARCMSRDTNRVDAAGVDHGGERACRRAWNKTFDPLEPAPNRRRGHRAARSTVFEQAQRPSQELGLYSDALSRVTDGARPPTPGSGIPAHAAITARCVALDQNFAN